MSLHRDPGGGVRLLLPNVYAGECPGIPPGSVIGESVFVAYPAYRLASQTFER
jgi:hypothetical protein